MTTAQMLTNVRTLLDETVEGTWLDTEIYRALSNGQIAIINLLMAIYRIHNKLPSVLINLIVETTATTDTNGEVPLPADFLDFINAETSTGTPIYYIKEIEYFRESNTYLKSSTTNPTVRLKSNLEFSLISTGITYSYIRQPQDITSTITSYTEPELLPSAHPAIVLYAFSEMLKKIERVQESTINFKEFIQLIQKLI